MSSLDIPEDAHQGVLQRVKIPCAGTLAKRGGGRIFEGGVLVVMVHVPLLPHTRLVL